MAAPDQPPPAEDVDAPAEAPERAEQSAAATRVGDRQPGDTDDLGSTEGMTAETGGLAGTSR